MWLEDELKEKVGEDSPIIRDVLAGVIDSFFGWYYAEPDKIDVWITEKSKNSRYLLRLFVRSPS
jgi:hypothetical protein